MSAVMVQPPIAQSTLTSVGAEPIFDLATLHKAWEILNIIYRYRMPVPASLVDRSDEGTLKFLSLIYTRVRAGKSVFLILPAFPFKSPNRKDKVLGSLPDKGEDLALAHLNGLCAAIADIYEPGAQLTIASDGLVYNDLLGVPDAEVYTYGEVLRKMVQTQGYRHLQFIRLRDLVHWKIDTPLDATTYEKLAGAFRQRLIDNFTPLDYDCVESIKADEDVCTTYRGYVKFLAKDLEHTFVEGGEVSKKSHKQKLEGIAKQMIARGKAFAEAIKKNYPDHVRLSIHPSCGSVKISVQVLPLAHNCVTPWHSTPCFTLDGRVEYGLNNVLSSEWMPFHYDGLFKIVKMKNADGQEVVRSCPPKYQFFTGMTPSPKDTGFTLFSPSHLVWHYLPSKYSVEYLRTLTWTVETVSFDHTKITDLPLVVDHFAHQRPCLRYHEPWPQEKTVFDPTKIIIQGVLNSEELCQILDSLLHDRRVAYWHCWEEGDWLISDNVTTMHTRSSFTGKSDRCLRRIHVD